MNDDDDQAADDKPLAPPPPAHLTAADANFLASVSSDHHAKVEAIGRQLDRYFALTAQLDIDPDLDVDALLPSKCDPDEAARRVRGINEQLQRQVSERATP
jgi:hypothetical protein